MEKKNSLAFFVFTILFTVGILAGSLYQVRIDEQTEMYEYLKSGISGYDVGIGGSIKAVCRDNFTELCALLISAFLPFGVLVVGVVLAIRGFMTGFAITAVLRTYGFFGMSLCIGNIVSALIVVPCFTGFGIFVLENYNTKSRVKLFLISTAFLVFVLLCDAVLKGALSVIFTRLWR